MARLVMVRLFACVLVGTPLLAQEGIQQGRIKKVNFDKGIVTITTDGKDQELRVTEQTKIFAAGNGESTQGIKDARLKVGTPVMFKAVDKDGQRVLVGLKIAQDGGSPGNQSGCIRRATVKKIDLEKMVLTLTVGDKDRDFALSEDTRVLDARGKDLKERLQGFKKGTAVFFKADRRDGKDVIVALKLADGGPGTRTQPRVDTSKLKPMTELGFGEYHGFMGGLYPVGKNERPAPHETAGLALAKQVTPIDMDGKPDADGKIVLLSVGMSNTAQASQGFQRQLAQEEQKNPHLVFVNGAQGGMTASSIQDAEDNRTGTRYWATVDERLKAAGLAREQVQVVWIKQADAGPTQGFPGYAQKLQQELARIVQLFPARFPNVKLVFLSSRTYGGYARTPLNPEPYAYESGFSVKWLIEQQLKGDPALNYDAKKGPVKAPWLSWGPYLWANGTTRRADGFFYEERDFAGDGTHQSPSGQEKVGKLLLQFFKTDTTCRPWFLAGEAK